MSDRSLRTLERRWNETGAIADEARFLVERVRVGELPQINLRLAAMCGCPPAVEAMGPGPDQLHVTEWFIGFHALALAWYPEMILRAAHSACWASTLTLLARERNPWMPGELGRVFQLTAFRILGGIEPKDEDVITPKAREHAELVWRIKEMLGERGDNMAYALMLLRDAGAAYADKRLDNVVEFTGGFTTESFVISRLVGPSEYSATIRWQDRAAANRPAPDWYYVRATQHNGHIAWSSPIWVG